MILKSSDFKLLAYLYHNNRESYSKIAKNTGLTREQVQYKIKKYLSDGLIRKFITAFNYSKLGYDYFVIILLRFKNKTSKATFIKTLSSNKNCISWGKVYSKYDLIALFIFKDEKDFNRYIESLRNLENYQIIRPIYSTLYPLKFLKNYKPEEIKVIEEYDEKIRNLDNKEKEILKILQTDNRTKLVDIASKTKISSELAIYKLRKLQKDKIIIGSRIQFNMDKLEYYFTLIFIETDLSVNTKDKIRNYCKKSKHINSLIIQNNKPQYIVQLFHKTEEELRETIDELRKLLELATLEIIPIGEDEPEVNTLPFINS